MIDAIPVSSFFTTSAKDAAEPVAVFAPDVERFNSVMARPAEVQEVAVAPLDAKPLNASPSLGDSIIAGLQSASNDVQAKWGHVSGLLANKELSMTEALNVQMSVLQVSVQYDLISKGISKSVQNLDQTLKTQ
jgi:type III secretion protein I